MNDMLELNPKTPLVDPMLDGYCVGLNTLPTVCNIRGLVAWPLIP